MRPATKSVDLAPSERFQRDDDMVFRRLGEEMVLVPIRRGIGDFDCFYILNETGRLLWERLLEPCSINDLTSALLISFDVTAEDAAADVQAFLARLETLKALKKTPGRTA